MKLEGSLPHLHLPATYPYSKSVHSIPCPHTHSTSWRSILILSSHLGLGLPSSLFPSRFPTKTLYTPLLSKYTCYTPRPSPSSWFDHLNNIWWGIRIIKLLIMSYSSLPCFLVSFKPNYLPQHPVLKHSHPTLLTKYERQFHTHTKQQAKL